MSRKSFVFFAGLLSDLCDSEKNRMKALFLNRKEYKERSKYLIFDNRLIN